MTSSTPRIVPQKQAQLSFTLKRKEPNQSIDSNPSQIENQIPVKNSDRSTEDDAESDNERELLPENL